MDQVIFNCLIPGVKCEWFHLKDFVTAFNAIHGTSYHRSKCLDVYGKDEKQPAQASKRPEVLIESDLDSEVPIVIERKAVIWPKDFQRDHSKEHILPDRVVDVLWGKFSDSTYELAFHADDLKGKKKRQVEGFGNHISRQINANVGKAKSPKGIGGLTPVRWSFRPLDPYEIDEPNRTKGIRIDISLSSSWDLQPVDFRRRRERALAGFAERFGREANKAGEKYSEYANCQKLLVVQFFGEGELVRDEEIMEMVKGTQVPNQIDQVWLTGREWVSLDEYELAWERVR